MTTTYHPDPASAYCQAVVAAHNMNSQAAAVAARKEPSMTTYNVAVSVVDLIDADSPEQAIADLAKRLEAAGFDVHDDPDTKDAFESDTPAEPDYSIRACLTFKDWRS